MEVVWIKLLVISNLTVIVKNQVILTLLNQTSSAAKTHLVKKIPSPSQDTLMLLQEVPVLLNQLVTNNQFPLLSMLKNGAHIKVVSFLIVELHLIMVYFLLVTPVIIGSLKTLGQPLGENKDLSDLNQETPVVLLIRQFIQMHDLV